MSIDRDIWIKLGWRALFAVPLIALGVSQLSNIGNPLGILFIIVGAIILAFPVARLLAHPVGSLIYPEDQFDAKLPMYSVAEAKIKKKQYGEALEFYEDIIRKYPNEVRPYIGMLDIAVVHLNDAALAKYIYERGMAVLKKLEDRESLTRMYKGICSRLDAKPEWQEKREISINGHPLNPYREGTSERDVPSAPRLE